MFRLSAGTWGIRRRLAGRSGECWRGRGQRGRWERRGLWELRVLLGRLERSDLQGQRVLRRVSRERGWWVPRMPWEVWLDLAGQVMWRWWRMWGGSRI